MSAASSSDVKLEIGHVLFIDIVGYSKLLITEQSEQMQKLREIVRGTEQFRVAEAEGKLLRLPTGDGGALVFRTSPEAPVLCAMEIAKALKDYPKLGVRMGVHSGPVNEITDLNEQANIAGAGINIAQRVMDCGDSGHILLSKHVADDLEQYPQWRSKLHDLGECEVKHGVRIHAVNFYTDDVGNRDVPEKFRQVKEKEQTAPAVPAAAVKPAGQSRVWIAALVIVAILGLSGAAIYYLAPGAVPKLQEGTPDAFVNSSGKDRAWLRVVVVPDGPIRFDSNGGVTIPVDYQVTNTGRSPANDVRIVDELFFPQFGSNPSERLKQICASDRSGIPFSSGVVFPSDQPTHRQVAHLASVSQMLEYETDEMRRAAEHPWTEPYVGGCVKYKYGPAGAEVVGETGFLYRISVRPVDNPRSSKLVRIGENVPQERVVIEEPMIGGGGYAK